MAQVKVIVLRTAGTNCDQETAHAFELTGASTRTVHVNQLIARPSLLEEFQILALPGGFSYGDDIAAGKILANQLIHHFQQEVRRFIDSDKLVLGICNGFQVLVKAGILPGELNPADSTRQRRVTITYNDSGKFEARWVYLAPATENCVFIQPGRRIYLPIAHGEGKVCFSKPEILQQIKDNKQIAYKYVTENGDYGSYPANPNGSTDHIAGLCDPTGRVLGLMPHPERFVHKTHHPRWTRQDIDQTDGLVLFTNAVNYFA